MVRLNPWAWTLAPIALNLIRLNQRLTTPIHYVASFPDKREPEFVQAYIR
jgi:hypothetical protein